MFQEEGEEIAVAPMEGGPDETLITVKVLEQTEYEIKTVKNGGVNGDSDVQTAQGSFSDLEDEILVDVLGHYEQEEFVAVKIILYRFV